MSSGAVSDHSSQNSSYINLMSIVYVFTEKTFIKRDLYEHERKRNWKGEIIRGEWVAERLQNEATALQLIAKQTTIPVPNLVGFGYEANGAAYLETELVPGIELSVVRNACRKQEGARHVEEGTCETCGKIAQENASRFIEQDMLPQLSKLKSTITGFNGFVLPPAWLAAYDTRSHWNVKTADTPSFVFCHGDLAAHNIMMDAETLQVKAIFDWEYAGYYPPEFQIWCVDPDARVGDIYLYTDDERDENTDKLEEFVALIDVD